MYQNPRTAEAYLSEANNRDDYYSPYQALSVGKKTFFEHRLRNVIGSKSPGVLLDVGCGTGDFLSVAESLGWQTWGIEASSFAAEIARARSQARIINAYLADTDLPEGYFDVIHASHVIEHLPDPLAAIIQLRSALKEEGCILVEVPNEEHFRLLNFALNLIRDRRATPPFGPKPFHFCLFTQMTLARLLTTAGFVRVNVLREGYGGPGRVDSAVLHRSVLVRVALTALRIWPDLDVRLGLGHYLVATARKGRT